MDPVIPSAVHLHGAEMPVGTAFKDIAVDLRPADHVVQPDPGGTADHFFGVAFPDLMDIIVPEDQPPVSWIPHGVRCALIVRFQVNGVDVIILHDHIVAVDPDGAGGAVIHGVVGDDVAAAEDPQRRGIGVDQFSRIVQVIVPDLVFFRCQRFPVGVALDVDGCPAERMDVVIHDPAAERVSDIQPDPGESGDFAPGDEDIFAVPDHKAVETPRVEIQIPDREFFCPFCANHFLIEHADLQCHILNGAGRDEVQDPGGAPQIIFARFGKFFQQIEGVISDPLRVVHGAAGGGVSVFHDELFLLRIDRAHLDRGIRPQPAEISEEPQILCVDPAFVPGRIVFQNGSQTAELARLNQRFRTEKTGLGPAGKFQPFAVAETFQRGRRDLLETAVQFLQFSEVCDAVLLQVALIDFPPGFLRQDGKDFRIGHKFKAFQHFAAVKTRCSLRFPTDHRTAVLPVQLQRFCDRISSRQQDDLCGLRIIIFSAPVPGGIPGGFQGGKRIFTGPGGAVVADGRDIKGSIAHIHSPVLIL